MTDDTEEVAVESVEPLYIHDGECWVFDPDLLAHDSGAQGVIAVQFREGGLWFLDGETRRWLNAEAPEAGKPKTRLRPVN